MDTTHELRPRRRPGVASACLAFGILGFQAIVSGQNTATGQTTPPPAEKDRPFSEGELDQLTAPIALYPDEVVSQILMASTYPLEVIQAHRWASVNKSLEGDALAKALEKQSWDPSVKSLVNFPRVLSQMNEKLDWTQKLGDAVLAQQSDVMESVQRLRHRAKDAGHLKTTEEQEVVVEEEVIVIQPTKTEVIYVPTYNPTVVYGSWPYPAYPPAYYYPPGYVYGAAAFSFAAGVAVGVAWGYAWGGCHWGHGGHHEVDIDINRNIEHNRNIDRSKYGASAGNRSGTAPGRTGSGGASTWKHDSSHRKGVRYPDAKTAREYGSRGSQGNRSSREAYRGRSATRPGASARPSTGSTSRAGAGSTATRSTGRSSSTGSSRSGSSVFRDYGSKSGTTKSASRGRSSRGRSSSSRSFGGGGRSRSGGARR